MITVQPVKPIQTISSLNTTESLPKQISGFIEYLKTSKFKGQKYQTKQSEICNL